MLTSLPAEPAKLVIVDGVFSMGGDIAKLPEIIPLCRKYGARFMSDDAHAIGVLGGGRGTGWHFDLQKDVDLIMGTFASPWPRRRLRHRPRRGHRLHPDVHPAVPCSARACRRRSSPRSWPAWTSREEPTPLERVNTRKARIQSELGFNTGVSETPIIPIIIGDSLKTYQMCKILFENGIFVNPVINPAVPPGRELLRTSYMATHTEEQLDRVLSVFKKVKDLVHVGG